MQKTITSEQHLKQQKNNSVTTIKDQQETGAAAMKERKDGNIVFLPHSLQLTLIFILHLIARCDTQCVLVCTFNIKCNGTTFNCDLARVIFCSRNMCEECTYCRYQKTKEINTAQVHGQTKLFKGDDERSFDNSNTYSPPTSSTPSSSMSLVKLDICPVKEERLPPTCPRD